MRNGNRTVSIYYDVPQISGASSRHFPHNPGVQESVNVLVETSNNTIIYIALHAVDKTNKTSELSNIVQVHVVDQKLPASLRYSGLSVVSLGFLLAVLLFPVIVAFVLLYSKVSTGSYNVLEMRRDVIYL